MTSPLLQWLASIGWTAFTWALAGWLALNLAALLLFLKRDRALVERYTSMWLAANLLLVAIGVGVPAITSTARLVMIGVGAIVPAAPSLAQQTPEVRVRLAD